MTDLIEKPNQNVADLLRSLADDLERNADKIFGGLVVIMPPEGNGLCYQVYDDRRNLVAFWQGVDFRVKQEISEVDDRRRNQQAFGAMR